RALNVQSESRERGARHSFEPLTRSASQPASEAPSSFMERLQEASVIPETPEAPVPAKQSGGSKYSLFIHSLFHIVLMTLVLASFALELTMTHDTGRSPQFESHFSFSI